MDTEERVSMSGDSDSETLAAVLAYLDGFSDSDNGTRPSSADGATARSSSDDTRASNDPVTRPTRRVRKKDVEHNRARYRERLELTALRKEEATLRERLEQLLRARSAVNREEESDRLTPLRRGILMSWRGVTKRQFQRRQASEEENARLKARVLEQRHVVKILKRIIEQQISRANHPLASARLYSPAWKAVCGDGDPREMMRTFAELLTNLKQIHSTTDDWIQKNALDQLPNGQFIASRVIPLSPTQVAVENVDFRLLPFSYEVVGNLYMTKAMDERCTVSFFYHEESQVEGRETYFSGKVFDNEDQSIRLRSHRATQRFVEPDRIVLTNAMRTDFVQVDLQDVPGVHLSEQYWDVFRPSEPNARDSCLLLSFSRVVLTVEYGIQHMPRVVNLLTKYFQGRMHTIVDNSIAVVEDWLLQPQQPFTP
ncbi:hypothetical protein Poli38472_007579 [Pythium oligandrum]|uniref:Uncharacterized protein n=1 Tax=Pythium oligandrum TaxID=41045 RepID=A0A8K1FQF9_PYTOL|nr:hypothetical protein Poli38472_007579 [Pythium oligandrum]|eukprot:TMW67907.1 hypothetical protein Poli38472_007579 [Pythium oligandrum]